MMDVILSAAKNLAGEWWTTPQYPDASPLAQRDNASNDR